MTETPMQNPRKLSRELGSPGVEALWKASQKAGIDVTKAEVQEVVRGSPSKQIFGNYSQVMVRPLAVHRMIVGRWILLILVMHRLTIKAHDSNSFSSSSIPLTV